MCPPYVLGDSRREEIVPSIKTLMVYVEKRPDPRKHPKKFIMEDN